MGAKASKLRWFDLGPPPSPSKQSQYTSCWHKAPLNYNHGWTTLHYAASRGNLRRIQEVIHKSGTRHLNKRDYYGKTPLFWAAYKGHRQCMEFLLQSGAEVNTECRHGGTPLHAVVSLYPDCTQLLIQHGADVNKVDNWGVTPMYLAAIIGQVEVIRVLIIAGAKLTYRNKKTGEIPPHLAVHIDFCAKLETLSRNPSSLQKLCRDNIRHHLADHPVTKLQRLPLPSKLKDYLLLSELGKPISSGNV